MDELSRRCQVSYGGPGGRREAMPITIVGSATHDHVHRHGGRAEQVGGTVWFAGQTLARLHFAVRVVSRLAEADRAIAEALVDAGIEARITPSTVTTVFHNRYLDSPGEPPGSGSAGPGTDRLQSVDSVAEPIMADCLSSALAHAEVCYLGALHPDDISSPALALVKRLKGPLIAMDVQGYTRHLAEGRVVPRVAEELPALLAIADIIKASLAEACLITGEATGAGAASALAKMNDGAEVLVTCGAEGTYLAPAIAEPDLDPTGAGDIFLAAYLAARLIGEPPGAAQALAAAHAAGRLADPNRIHRLGSAS